MGWFESYNRPSECIESSQITLNGFNSDVEMANALNCFCDRLNTSVFRNEIQKMSDKLKDVQDFEID